MGFKRFDPEDFVVSADTVTSTVWSNNAISLNTYFTSSVQKRRIFRSLLFKHYIKLDLTDPTAATQFSIAYGNKNGGGGVRFDGSVPNKTSTSTIYGQYRTLVLEDENANFTFGPTFYR